jgi:RNA polymerase sigma-70 factor, ECF subfamily
VVQLVPDPECFGLLALMLYNESRRAARTDAAGDIVLLADQDRSRWDRAMIAEADRAARQAALGAGPFSVQAIIAGFHARAASAAETDWKAIAEWYGVLLKLQPWPIVALNRAVAIGESEGAEAGLRAIDQAMEPGALGAYHLAHAARADFCRRLGRVEEARAAYRRALELAQEPQDRRFIERRLRELQEPGTP